MPPSTSQQLHLFGSCASHGTLLWRRAAEHASKHRTTSDNVSKHEMREREREIEYRREIGSM